MTALVGKISGTVATGPAVAMIIVCGVDVGSCVGKATVAVGGNVGVNVGGMGVSVGSGVGVSVGNWVAVGIGEGVDIGVWLGCGVLLGWRVGAIVGVTSGTSKLHAANTSTARIKRKGRI